MLISLRTLLAALSSIFRSRAALQLENLALRHQIGILQRSAKKRPKLTPADRLLWVALSNIWRDWRSALAIVKPETVVAWHRAGFRLFWTWKVLARRIPQNPIYSARSLSHKTSCKYEVSTFRNSAATRSRDFASVSRQSVLMPFTI
jgi:hypothetical protein